jgi:hypothetical protein
MESLLKEFRGPYSPARVGQALSWLTAAAARRDRDDPTPVVRARPRPVAAAADVYYSAPVRRGGPQGHPSSSPTGRLFCNACHREGHKLDTCDDAKAQQSYDSMLKVCGRDVQALRNYCHACHVAGHRWLECPDEKVRALYRARRDAEYPRVRRSSARGGGRRPFPRAYLAELHNDEEEYRAQADAVEAYRTSVVMRDEEDYTSDDTEDGDHRTSWDFNADATTRGVSGN